MSRSAPAPTRRLRSTAASGSGISAAGSRTKTLLVGGIPGNALGAYLDGGTIVTEGNAQDAAATR